MRSWGDCNPLYYLLLLPPCFLGFGNAMLFVTEEPHDEAYAMLGFKAAIAEDLPQLMLQSYVGVSYGKLDPSDPDFELSLVISIAISLLFIIVEFVMWCKRRRATLVTPVVRVQLAVAHPLP
jgi:hypothetical protein